MCDVEEPEIHFSMDQYTDVTRLTKPVTYISINEIVETHKVRSCSGKSSSHFLTSLNFFTVLIQFAKRHAKSSYVAGQSLNIN